MLITNYEFPARVTQDFHFAFVSDIHNADIRSILHAITMSDAQAVLVGGDFINGGDDYQNGLSFLSESAKLLPTFVSLGNHERRFGIRLLSLIEKTGVTLLDDDAVFFHGVHIGGLSSGFGWDETQGNLKKTPRPNLVFLDDFATRSGYKVLLCHHPEYYPRYIRALGFDVDLVLSGHAHGGQWRLFGQGVFAPGQGFFPKYTSGLYDGRFLVGRGLGDSHRFPPRIFNRPELIFVTLKKL